LVCLGLGWFLMPQTRYQRCLDVMVETSIQYEVLLEAEPTPTEVAIKRVLLTKERDYRLAKICWVYENKLRKVDLKYRQDYNFSIFWLILGAISGIMMLFSRSIVRLINK
jgi:hypothetical protein